MNTRDPIHVVFAGGGTGGHLFPGLAVAGRLREQMPSVRVTFAGSGRPLEREHVAAAGYAHLALRCRPLPRRPWHLASFLAENLAGYLAARRFVRRQNVGLVVGLGGFASVPMARAAIALRRPLVLLEQNAVPGRATRWLARRAAAVCLTLPESRCHFHPACTLHVTGNPIREGFLQGARDENAASFPGSAWERTAREALPPLALCLRLARGHGREGVDIREGGAWDAVRCQAEPGNEGSRRSLPSSAFPGGAWERGDPLRQWQLLVLGGSGGARALNENVPRALGRLGRRLAGWSVVHQSGAAGFDATRRLYQQLGVPATVVPFVADVPRALAASDLAVCRAGGTTLAELAAAGVPGVLVPYSHAADDHQRRNAEAYAASGGCLVVEQRGPAGPLDARLAETLAALVPDARLRRAMSRSLRRLARPRAAEDVTGLIGRLCCRVRETHHNP